MKMMPRCLRCACVGETPIWTRRILKFLHPNRPSAAVFSHEDSYNRIAGGALERLAALAIPAASAQSAIADVIGQGMAQDARLDTAHALQAFLQAEELAPSDANELYRIAREYTCR
jgi:hypothetical protein